MQVTSFNCQWADIQVNILIQRRDFLPHIRECFPLNNSIQRRPCGINCFGSLCLLKLVHMGDLHCTFIVSCWESTESWEMTSYVFSICHIDNPRSIKMGERSGPETELIMHGLIIQFQLMQFRTGTDIVTLWCNDFLASTVSRVLKLCLCYRAGATYSQISLHWLVLLIRTPTLLILPTCISNSDYQGLT
jgi:hypothetical protein